MQTIGSNDSVLRSSVVKFFYLYDIYWSSSSSLKYTDANEPVVFEGKTYAPFPVKSSGVSTDSEGKVNDVTLTVSNIDRLIQLFLETTGFMGNKATIRQVFADQDGNIKGSLVSSYRIKNATVTSTEATFTLSTGVDVLGATIPARKIFSNFCSHQFRDANCKYTGAAVQCSKIFDDCIGKNNNLNFGGFPALVKANVYI
jgi:lambda family phage minor tail protein L